MEDTGAFKDLGFVQFNRMLAPFTHARVGGPAEVLAEPQTREDLAKLVRICTANKVPLRILGGGTNLLIRSAGVSGVVLRLAQPEFQQIEITGKTVRCGAGADTLDLIKASSRAGLGGLESLVGFAGTVGGAVITNAGDARNGIGQLVRRVEVMEQSGEIVLRDSEELRFDEHSSNIDEPVILSVELVLEPTAETQLVRRLRRAMIRRMAHQPPVHQSVGRIFRDPRGLDAADLISKAGLGRTKLGAAEVSDRNGNFFLTNPGVTTEDILRLADLVRERVQERFHVSLEREIAVW
ncbi:MAG: UDP-N-acetylmuramate dehydrogenase [Gemmataceae bacterium]